jgi:hypothetical protein
VRGDFDAAQAEAEMALVDSSADRIHVLIRLADIALYLGDFSEVQRYGHAALDTADTPDTVNLRAAVMASSPRQNTLAVMSREPKRGFVMT